MKTFGVNCITSTSSYKTKNYMCIIIINNTTINVLKSRVYLNLSKKITVYISGSGFQQILQIVGSHNVCLFLQQSLICILNVLIRRVWKTYFPADRTGTMGVHGKGSVTLPISFIKIPFSR